MKNISTPNKKTLIVIALLWAVLLVLLFLRLTMGWMDSAKSARNLREPESGSQLYAGNWEDVKLRELVKQQLWLEQQLALSESDSFSLGINLKDSVVQVQLHGTVLFSAKIVACRPKGFLANINQSAYLSLFGVPARITTSTANIPKRAWKQVIAPAVGAEKETVKTDALQTDALYWTFSANMPMEVVVNGLLSGEDTVMNVHPTKAIVKHQFHKRLEIAYSGQYSPVLYLWLNNSDAKTIYRTLPEKAQFIFRN